MKNISTQSTFEFNSLVDKAQQLFRDCFECDPTWMAVAPGRVNLIGEHVDYNLGIVLPMAINRYTVASASLLPDSKSTTVFSSQFENAVVIDMSQPMEAGEPNWANYVQGVMAGFIKLGHDLPALQIGIHSSVPPGAGLSSSAALEVATATLLEAVLGVVLEKNEKAFLCQQAEHEFARVPCGLMDQFVSVFAQTDHLLLLDCRDNTFQHVPFKNEDLVVLIINSKVKHELGSTEYKLRRQQCTAAAHALGVKSLRDVSIARLESEKRGLQDAEYRRTRHVVTEIERTRKFVEALQANDLVLAGGLLYESHRSLRDDYEVSCDELDDLVKLAQEIGIEGGVYGSRLTGGGFGGCTVSLVRQGAVGAIVEKISSTYQGTSPLDFFVSRPTHGAR